MRVQQKSGKWGEDLAAAFLVQNGYEILHRNWRFKRAEVDIIAKDRDILVFLEVKARANQTFGRPEEMVGNSKKRMLFDAASAYMHQTAYDWEIRFDIIAITGEPGKPYEIEHFKDAFYPGQG